MERPQRVFRFPVFIRDIHAVRRKSREEVEAIKGEIHDQCGAEIVPAMFDIDIDLDSSDDPDHPVELAMHGIYAKQCICPEQEDFEEVPHRRAELTEGTLSFIKQKWDEECGIVGASRLLTGKPYLREYKEQVLPLHRVDGEILIWNDYTHKLRFGSKK